MKAGLTERPLDMNAVGFRPLHRRFVQCLPGSLLKSLPETIREHRRVAKAKFVPVRRAGECCLYALRDHGSFLFRQGCIDVQREVVAFSTQCCNKKIYLVLDEPGYEVHIA